MKTLFAVICLSLALLLSGCSCGTNCTPGTQACACKAASACNDGLTCNGSNQCVAPTAAGVQVDALARGCEVLLTEAPGTAVLTATFKDGVKGTFIRQEPKVALTFVAGGDKAMSGSVELGMTGPSTGLTVTKASCVDVKGAALASATVSVH